MLKYLSECLAMPYAVTSSSKQRKELCRHDSELTQTQEMARLRNEEMSMNSLYTLKPGSEC